MLRAPLEHRSSYDQAFGRQNSRQQSCSQQSCSQQSYSQQNCGQQNCSQQNFSQQNCSQQNCGQRKLVDGLKRIVGDANILLNEPMSLHTTLEIGGPADVFVKPRSVDECMRVIAWVRDTNSPYFLLGAGSDVLVSDAGYRGVVITTTSGMSAASIEGCCMRCEAGTLLTAAADMAAESGLSGLEFACGIPGTVGGAVFMNAGAYDGCMADVVVSARVLTPHGQLRELSVDELGFGYRTSLVSSKSLSVLDVIFSLERSDVARIRAKMDDLTRRRAEKQPLELPSAGSTFKRPEGYFVGKLVSDAGLRGYRVGGAAISCKHAGFIVNLGGATAADVCAVIAHVQKTILEKFGVKLEPELRFVGEF